MYKLSETGPAFCVCAGGMSVYIMYRVDLLTSLVTLVFAVLFLTFCTFVLSRCGSPRFDSAAVKAIAGIYALISAAVSVTLSASLVTDGGMMDKSFYPLLILLTGLFAVCFGMSNRSATVSVSFITAVICAVAMAVLMLLCLLRTDFSVPKISSPQPALFLLLFAFSVCDTVLVLPLIRGKPAMVFTGGILAHLYAFGMTVTALSVLSESVFKDSNMPWLTLWRSTFITSFLNSFEIIGICAFFILNAVKAGIAANLAFEVFGKRYAVFIMLAVFCISVLLTLFSGFIYAAAAVSVFFALFITAYSLKNKKDCPNQ